MRHVLVLPFGASSARVGLLAGFLTAGGLDVIIGPGPGGSPSSQATDDADALVLALGAETVSLSDEPWFIKESARRGELIHVVLEQPVSRVPTLPGSWFDLSTWPCGDSTQFESLITCLKDLAIHAVTHRYWETVSDGTTIDQSRTGVAELRRLTDEIGQLAEVLIDDSVHTHQLRLALTEVGRTYRVVKIAIESFFSAGLNTDTIDGKAYLKLERGFLAQVIENGRGHCGRIGTLYRKVGGLREGIEPLVSPALLVSLDDTFDRLASADGDVFSAMDRLGFALTGQARVIATLVLNGRQDLAREEILKARTALLPLEEELDQALASFQAIEQTLGHAEAIEIEGEAPTVIVQTVNIGGSATSVNIVAAKTIQDSAKIVADSSASKELKGVLDDLQRAVGELTRFLADDEAELAARDLKELSEEAVKPAPRPAFWRRAADNLLASAKTVTDVGLPVIELVTKAVALLA